MRGSSKNLETRICSITHEPCEALGVSKKLPQEMVEMMGHFGCFGATGDGICGVDFVAREKQEADIVLTEGELRWVALKALAPQFEGHDWSKPRQKRPNLLRL